MLARFAAAIAAMVVVVTASNILVQYPVDAQLGPFNLKDLLTWGAFTYPFAFLVTDLTNRAPLLPCHAPQVIDRNSCVFCSGARVVRPTCEPHEHPEVI